jgi:tRNA threonylcarbamoyladenosine modification (KEOPS) complex Cgi121 subunit
LILKFEDFNKYVVIAGFRNVNVKNIDKFFTQVKEKLGDACVQFFDAKLIASWQHLYFAVLNALNAFKNKLNISNSLGIEILLYASAQRQIKEAVSLIGIRSDTTEVAVVIVANSRNEAMSQLNTVSALLKKSIRDEKVLKLTSDKAENIKRLFQITSNELEATIEKEGDTEKALIDLVIEHVALLVTQR